MLVSCFFHDLRHLALLPSSAQLNPTPTLVGWAEIALISTGKVPRRQFQYGYWPNLEGRFVEPSLTDY